MHVGRISARWHSLLEGIQRNLQPVVDFLHPAELIEISTLPHYQFSAETYSIVVRETVATKRGLPQNVHRIAIYIYAKYQSNTEHCLMALRETVELMSVS